MRVSEKACPFCSGALSLQAPPLARTPVARLSRAALFALGTSAASIAACTSGTGPVGGDAGVGTGTGSDSGPEQDLPPDHPPPVADGGILDAAHTLPPKDARED